MLNRVKNQKDVNRIKKKNQDTIKATIKKYQDHVKFLFYQMVFDEEELYSMFKDFYLKFMPNYIIGATELTSLIELMASSEYLGKQVLEEKVFPIIGVHKNLMDIAILNKESYLKDHKISSDVHEQLFEKLNDGSKHVRFFNLLPYLMLFFIVSLNGQLDTRLKHYRRMLDRNMHTSIDQCFQRAGLHPDYFNKQVITYRMIEQVVADFRSCFPNSFDFKQMDTVLKLVRERMDVDSFTRIERHKETYFNSVKNQQKKAATMKNGIV